MRLFDLIKRAATELEAAPAGVWANFGKPYACLGELVQVRLMLTCLVILLQYDPLPSNLLSMQLDNNSRYISRILMARNGNKLEVLPVTFCPVRPVSCTCS